MSLAVVFASLYNLLTSPELLLLLLAAVPIGMFFGAVPGLGGKLGIALLIPFVFGMEPLAGAVFLLAMHAVVHTGGSVPSILFGIPGTGPDAATVVDGHPMAQNGEAGRALGASLGASAFGGLIGALVLALLLPVLQPIILLFGPAEFFWLAIMGITTIAALSGGSLLKGLIVGCFGLMVAFVGLDPISGIARYTFGQLFLWDGVDIITAVLAIYAVPEMIALGVEGGSVSRAAASADRLNFRSVWQGTLDVYRHRWLSLRTAALGAVLGMIPGIGGDAAAWICYGHAAQSSKTPERFGHGAVEGVIGPETANNSKEGGALLPTLFFGIPGSSGMALLLGAFVMLGIQPGPQLISQQGDLVWTLVWALVLANLIAAALFFALAPWMGLLTFIRGTLVIPLVLVLALLGSFLSSGDWRSLIVMMLLGVLGYALKRHGWPRQPLVVGLVLGGIVEVSLHQATTIWGAAFMLRPQSLVLIALTAAGLGTYVWRRRKRSGDHA